MRAITDRLQNLCYWLPKTVFDEGKKSVKTIAGIVSTPLSMMTLGKVNRVNRWANLTQNAKGILPNLFMRSLTVINPHAARQAGLCNSNMGIITKKIAKPFFKKAVKTSESTSWFKKHVISRGAYAVGGVVAIVTRTADLILGLCALPVAVVTCGSLSKVNTFVANQLEFFAVINDVCMAFRGIVNPQQFKPLKPKTDLNAPVPAPKILN